MKKPLLLIPGYRKRQVLSGKRRALVGRWEYTLKISRFLMEDFARRIHESKKIFPWKFYRGDFHSHTQHSDGWGTVAETAAMVEAAGLDFQYVTDHWGITQGPECRELGLWVGQEPVTQDHHIGIIGLKEAYVPRMDFLKDYTELQRLGATVFVPHPTGWWPRTVYQKRQVRLLDKLPSPFLMEICNGANNLVQAFDYTDESAIQCWDRLLCLGRRVHAMGNTDAHMPQSIGIIWNGVFASRCTESSILKTVKKGHSFVSNGPLIHIQLGKTMMGSEASPADRRKAFRIFAADSRGLSVARMMVDGRVQKEWTLGSVEKWNDAISLKKYRPRKYVRVEIRTPDGLRAYSNPIYFS